jgi:hypothetical protein
MINRFKLYKNVVSFSLATVICVLSACSNQNYEGGLFVFLENTSASAPSTSFFDSSELSSSVEESQVNTKNINNGYSYVDFSTIDWEKAIAIQREESILTQPGYCYGLLNDDDKRTYEEIYYTAVSFQSECRLTTTDVDKVKEIFSYVTADHPEIFWIDGYKITHSSRNDKVISIDFSMKTTMDEEEISTMQKKIAKYVKECLANINDTMSDYEKIRYIYEYIITNTEYKLDSENNQNICSVFVGGESVCQGFSVATQYLLESCGIESVTITGEAKNRGSHAWNLVKLEGEYYYLDTTWGSPSFSKNVTISDNIITYDYFCSNETDMSISHTPNDDIPLPNCNSDKYSYYNQEGFLFIQWSREDFTKSLQKSIQNGKNYLSVRFASEEIRDEAMEDLIDSYQFFDCVKEAASIFGKEVSEPVSYFENNDLHTVTFIWNME